jgi:reverse gyrase
MEKTLVVVESPAKAKTIKKYLGPGYEVKASVGHIKDLPTSVPRGDAQAKGSGAARQKKNPTDGVLGVDVQHGFVPHYETVPGKEKIIKELRKAAQDARRVFLATDPDREGEAIAWHVSEELGKPAESIYRVLFNELTEKTIKQAIKSPGRLDPDKYNAQQARRILDRIVGYQLSPLLWQKVQYGLSAGRVQSVALKLIVTARERWTPLCPRNTGAWERYLRLTLLRPSRQSLLRSVAIGWRSLTGKRQQAWLPERGKVRFRSRMSNEGNGAASRRRRSSRQRCSKRHPSGFDSPATEPCELRSSSTKA